MRVALCQLNFRVGDLAGNKKLILEALSHIEAEGVELALFPELAICSYPAEDLLLKPGFIQECQVVLNEIAAEVKSCTVLVGAPLTGAEDKMLDHNSLEARWPGLYNGVAVLRDGKIQSVAYKSHLPNYAVFDEHRYFAEGTPPEPILVGDKKVGIAICEDLWVESKAVENLKAGVDLVAHLSASPYYAGKQKDRLETLARRAKAFGCPIFAVNLVGGQDELVFDGGSMLVSAEGEVIAAAPQFEEGIFIIDVAVGEKITPNKTMIAPTLETDEEIYQALVLGTRDYVQKNGFEKVLIGISGGIDSALVAAIATDALGAENVCGVAMPSRFSSEHSLQDARALAQNLGIELREISIEEAHIAFLNIMEDHLKDDESSQLAKENVQARIRGTLIMALSNINNWLVLTTGNKSENAVGYSTLYGDTAGAFAVIKDLWKMEVYRLAKMKNEKAGETIPENILTKPPSAELRPNQRDDQSLPPYDELDPILKYLVEDDMLPAEIISKYPGKYPDKDSGKHSEMVNSVAKLVDMAEYKRRQAPPGVRISSKAFGKDRRLPITNLYL